jgi:pimeloyl-ACP methyl ester carboxylesterase
VSDFSVDVDGARLAGETAGEGAPVVLLHGLTATRRYVVMGSKNLERAEHRVVAYDARGHGRSSPAGDYGYEALARDLGAVMDDAGIERATLAGASMGAHTLLRFALEHPERAAALVVITPGHEPGGRGSWKCSCGRAWRRSDRSGVQRGVDLVGRLGESLLELLVVAVSCKRPTAGWSGRSIARSRRVQPEEEER